MCIRDSRHPGPFARQDPRRNILKNKTVLRSHLEASRHLQINIRLRLSLFHLAGGGHLLEILSDLQSLDDCVHNRPSIAGGDACGDPLVLTVTEELQGAGL